MVGVQTTEPGHPPSTDERNSPAQPGCSSSPLKCTSHLGFSLGQVISPPFGIQPRLTDYPQGGTPITGGTHSGFSYAPVIPRRGTVLLFAILLIVLTLAACGDDSQDVSEGDGTPTPLLARPALPMDGGTPVKLGEDDPKTTYSFDSVSTGMHHTCGVMIDGSVACWGDNKNGQSTPPEGQFRSVGVGEDHARGVMIDGSVTCWGYGYNEYGQSTPPEGEFVSVSAESQLTCGMRMDGSVACWGLRVSEAPEGEYGSVSVWRWHTWGVRTEGTPLSGLLSLGTGQSSDCAPRDKRVREALYQWHRAWT